MKSKAHLVVGGVFGLAVYLFSSCGENAGTPAPVNTTETTVSGETPTNTDPMSNKGIGPVKTVSLGDISTEMSEKGKALYENKCTACHKWDAKHVGPPLQGVTKRRTPEWVMNMILNPVEMTEKDPVAKELLAQYMAPMANQSLTEEEARNILEYFRSLDK
ncbi:MAG: cytochrome c [Bacteroidia bacterium]|nr:cytochrome c [Bacteroidia bacterium]